MARQFGTDSSIFNTLSTPLTDPNGLPIIDTGNGFGSSPLGISLREQIQFGLPNASFNLLPPDPTAAISEGQNPLPFWQIQTTPNITATPTYDTTTQTWGIKVDPGTAPSGDYIELKTRSWVTTDDNIALRQFASLTASKGGTYAGTTQWNLTLSASYFDHANASLGSAVIGTIYDNTTWTSVSGTTTSGGSAISASASWAEFAIKLTTTQTVSTSTFVTLKSLLLATSTPANGFIVTDTYTSSGTWTRPTGVTALLAVVGVGGGGGGMGGACDAYNANTANGSRSGGSGGSSSWAIIRELYVGDQTAITVGIGTAGVGGAGTSFSKAAAATTTALLSGAVGGNAGASTFGAYLTIPGGSGPTAYAAAGGAAGAVATSTAYGLALLGSVAGTGQTSVGASGSASTFSQLPYWQSFTAGTAGSNGTASGGSTNFAGTAGAAGSAGIIGAGGGSGRWSWDGVSTMTGVSGQVGGYGAGSGAGAAAARIAGTVTPTVNGGVGGNASANSGASGGGGGGALIVSSSSANYNASTITMTSGAGGSGGAGRIYVIYVA